MKVLMKVNVNFKISLRIEKDADFKYIKKT